MNKTVSYFLFLLWLCYLIISSVLLFTRGFLLTRTVQKVNSTCAPFEVSECTSDMWSESREEKCSKISSVVSNYEGAVSVCLPPRARVVLLIVDALRYDFAVYDDGLERPLPYQNKMPAIRELVDKYPEHTRLYKFIADPPTTTMQRLKALTTGSLPTFIDAGSNFATYEISEDNLIDQLIGRGRDVVFTGDDTWGSLYPNRFKRDFPYPSFNVWDLDTVDDGVRENLSPELNNSDWSLLIGHFLGVDHCGHRYGPSHAEMGRKLGEINQVIRDVVEHIDTHDENTVLFVIGDHGMTSTGDHGGGSEDETTAALFLYSKQPLLKFTDTITVKQVDLVPTLSVILGVATPFQNLGITILDALPISNSTLLEEKWRVALFTLWSNVQQMMRYIREYSSSEDLFDKGQLEEFNVKFAELKGKVYAVDESTFEECRQELVGFLSDLRKMCEDVWVQFESFSMARGLLFLFLSIFFVYIITDGIPVSRLPEIFMSSFIFCSYIALALAVSVAVCIYYLDFSDNLLSSIFFATGLVSQVMLGMLIIQNWEIISLNWYAKSQKEKIPNLICRIVLIFNLCGLFSNSYIIEESFVLLFLLVTVILVSTFEIMSNSNKKNRKLKFLTLAVIVAALARASMYFWRCREEQQWCFNSPHEVSNITTKIETTKLQWALTVIFLIIFIFATKEWLKSCGNLNGYSMTVMSVKFLPTVIVVFIAGYWVLKRAPPSKQVNPFKSLNILAWTVYTLTAFGIGSCVLQPLCTYIIPSSTTAATRSIPNLFQTIKNIFNNGNGKGSEDIPVICGLGTVYSSVFFIIGVYLTLLFALLLGDAVAPSAVIMFAIAVFLLIVTSIIRIEKAKVIDDLFNIPNVSILVWIILSQYFFYASGHQPTFPNISWEAAFIGNLGGFSSNVLPAVLVIANTFCSNILMGVLLPLVLITPFTVFVMVPSALGKKNEMLIATERGEVVLYERRGAMFSSMLTLGCKYIAGHGIRVFASMLAATIHCRHLMVWNIFAPKLIFESIGMFVTIASVLVGYLILVRINKKVEELILKLTKMS